jgi:NADH dehydrogenase FAD-containing subunit
MKTIIVGGGFAEVKTALQLGKQETGKITLISNNPYFCTTQPYMAQQQFTTWPNPYQILPFRSALAIWHAHDLRTLDINNL